MRGVRVEARAKLNLGLAVGPRREDGFHDLATIFQSISLADTLTIRPRRRGFSLAVRYEDVSVPRSGRRTRAPARARVPRGPENLVLRAARRMAERHGFREGAAFTLIKRIPAGAGLGGGSADAAAAIAGLAKLLRIRMSAVERRALGAEIGSDVPFALLGGTALGLGRGERLSSIRLIRPFRALLAVPSWRVSTADAFRRLDRTKYGLTRRRATLRFQQHLGGKAIRPQDALRLGNVFEDVLGSRRSMFLSLRARLERAGIERPHMTGSGSAVFGLMPDGIPAGRILDRFVGNEAIYVIRSRGTSLTYTTLR